MLQFSPPNWSDAGPNVSALVLFESQIPFARRIAERYLARKGYEHRGFHIDDVETVAYLGLHRAVKNYDPLKGVPFASWINLNVTYALKDFLRQNRSIVRRPKEHKGEIEGDDVSLSAPLDQEDEGAGTLLDGLKSDLPDPEQALSEEEYLAEIVATLRPALDALSERERAILQNRHLSEDPLPLRVLAERWDISLQRVGQIEATALKKLRVSLERIRQIEVEDYDKCREDIIAKAYWKDDAKCYGVRLSSLKADDNRLVDRIRSLPNNQKDTAGNVTRHAVTCRFGFDTSPFSSELHDKIKRTRHDAELNAKKQADYRARALVCGLTWAREGAQ
ncbi:MAG TPA: sigma-70 family RNA polymerase sigma factor [Acidocella sp.]|jgi:RNA polymerase sigma factor (sigma-70 family)|uniref:sigma-70 family RNA polymerase sigma factor n=1 Tax=Acidocella sp. TaxID=50710 RepID=UPI002CB4F2DB|nr:sigma-70 family RNA polymerase sigma factor [Acidocella sp.]HVE20464.1 sigma-70 family RNA polymerase sigma factor [Acidocella sp.]